VKLRLTLNFQQFRGNFVIEVHTYNIEWMLINLELQFDVLCVTVYLNIGLSKSVKFRSIVLVDQPVLNHLSKYIFTYV
jgi:hypothetical protein